MAPDGSGYTIPKYDLIIHCAGCVQHSNWDNVGLDLFEDNVFLTRNLTRVPHVKFVFISFNFVFTKIFSSSLYFLSWSIIEKELVG